MKLIQLCGKYAHLTTQLDDEDYERLKHIDWYGTLSGDRLVYAKYSKRRGSYKVNIYMARCVLRLAHNSPLVPDHIDGNSLNNCRDNLRAVTQSVNIQNNPRRRAGEVIGVGLLRGRWRARVIRNYQEHHLGMFDSREEAEAAVRTFERDHT